MSLHTVIQKLLSEATDPDPDVIVEHLMSALSRTAREEILREVLRTRVRLEYSSYRSRQRKKGEGRSKWERLHLLASSPVLIAGRAKFLGDCTADELDLIAAEHDAHAAQQARLAEMYRAYATEMRTTGARVFSDLQHALQAAAA